MGQTLPENYPFSESHSLVPKPRLYLRNFLRSKVPANSSTSPIPGGPSAWQRPGPHPQLVMHPTLNLRPLLLIDAVQHQAPPQPVTPPQGPHYSQSISPSSTSICVHRPVHHPTRLYPKPLQKPRPQLVHWSDFDPISANGRSNSQTGPAPAFHLSCPI